jgi:integrase
LAIDSKLRGCDLVGLRVRDVAHGDHVLPRATVIQQKTGRPVRFQLTDQAREAVGAWITSQHLPSGSFLFPSRKRQDRHLSTRQYARIVQRWVSLIGRDPADYETHSLRRTKATLIYRRTKNLRAVQLLLGHTKLDYLRSRTMSRSRFVCLIWRGLAALLLDISILPCRHFGPARRTSWNFLSRAPMRG